MEYSIFSKKRILLLGSGELGKELVIESKRLGLEVIAIDRYEKAPAMQVADYSRVIDMGDKNILKSVIKEFMPDFVVPEIEALSIEALKELEVEGFNIVPNARTVEITMNRDKIRDLVSRDLKIKNLKMIPDGDGVFTGTMGMLVNKPKQGFGMRSWRYSALIDDRKVIQFNEESGLNNLGLDDDPYEVSDPDTMLEYFNTKK